MSLAILIFVIGLILLLGLLPQALNDHGGATTSLGGLFLAIIFWPGAVFMSLGQVLSLGFIFAPIAFVASVLYFYALSCVFCNLVSYIKNK